MNDVLKEEATPGRIRSPRSAWLLRAGVAAGFLLLAAGIYWWLSRVALNDLNEQLMAYTYYFLEATVLLILAGVYLARKTLFRVVASLDRKTAMLLVIIALTALVLTSFVAPRTNRIFYDEFFYQEQGMSLAYLQRAQLCDEGSLEYGTFQCARGRYNKWPNGYPYLLSLWYRLCGVSESGAFIINNANCFISILIVFGLVLLLFDSARAGLMGALSLAIIPMYILWSNTAAVEPTTAGAAALCMLLWFLFIKHETGALLFLAMMVTVFAMQFRMESMLLLPLVGITLALFRVRTFAEIRFWLLSLLACILLIPLCGHVLAVKDDAWGAVEQARFSLAHFRSNLPVNVRFYCDNEKFPLIVSLCALIGAVAPGQWKQRLVLCLWFLAFWGVFLFFYAGSTEHGADVRYSLVSYVPLAALAGSGAHSVISFIKKMRPRWKPVPVMLALFAVSMFNFFPLIRAEGQIAWEARADRAFAAQAAERLSKNAIVLTYNPAMFFLRGKNAAQLSLAIYGIEYVRDYYLQKYAEGVYLYWNFWCNSPMPGSEYCKQCIDLYEVEEVLSRKVGWEKLALYRIIGPKGAPFQGR